MTFAPDVPKPIQRKYPALLELNMTSENKIMNLSPTEKFEFWTYNGSCPGPFIRCRVGDIIRLTHTNNDTSGMSHNIDFHAVTGPGGGAALTLVEEGKTKIAMFKMLNPGL